MSRMKGIWGWKRLGINNKTDWPRVVVMALRGSLLLPFFMNEWMMKRTSCKRKRRWQRMMGWREDLRQTKQVGGKTKWKLSANHRQPHIYYLSLSNFNQGLHRIISAGDKTRHSQSDSSFLSNKKSKRHRNQNSRWSMVRHLKNWWRREMSITKTMAIEAKKRNAFRKEIVLNKILVLLLDILLYSWCCSCSLIAIPLYAPPSFTTCSLLLLLNSFPTNESRGWRGLTRERYDEGISTKSGRKMWDKKKEIKRENATRKTRDRKKGIQPNAILSL